MKGNKALKLTLGGLMFAIACQSSQLSGRALVDANCEVWNYSQCKCDQCKDGYWYDQAAKLCKLPNDNCKTFCYDTGECTSCPRCYALIGPDCYPTPGAPEYCVQCQDREWFSYDTVQCQPVNPDCDGFDEDTGYCTSCLDGSLVVDENGQCVTPPQAPGSGSGSGGPCQITDNNCHQWDYDACQCAVCSGRYWFNQSTRKCEQVSDQCKYYDSSNGHCTDCYDPGLEVNSDGQCTASSAPGSGSGSGSDLCGWRENACHRYDSDGCCEVCTYRYYFNSDGVCTHVRDSCHGYDPSNGDCTDCYHQFHLENGDCVPDSP